MLAIVTATSGLALGGAANAATASQNFNVTATLTAKCEITAAPADVAFAYTSFQGSAQPSTGGGFSVRCTNSLPYSLSLNTTTGTVIGLAYTLSVPGGTFTGSGSAVNHTVTGTMASGQSGTCAATPPATCSGSNQHTLIVTY